MTDAIPNAAQIDYWNGEVGRRWARLQVELDGVFAEITATAIAAAVPRVGESVLDIGCGCGGSVLALAAGVAPTGRVLGLDISKPMLEVARERLVASGAETATVLEADAATHAFEPGTADLVFSRFGVMFFEAPAAAFANIRSALKPGGRLAFVCWRPYKDNPFFAAPHWAAKPHLPPDEAPAPDPYAPGPFAFADPERIRSVLEEAGFSAVDIAPADVTLPLAGPGNAEAATRLVTQIGPVARALASASAEQRRAAEAAVGVALAAYDGPDGLRMPARLWVVTASA